MLTKNDMTDLSSAADTLGLRKKHAEESAVRKAIVALGGESVPEPKPVMVTNPETPVEKKNTKAPEK